MPNKKSAIKRVRQNERRRIRNKSKRSALRTAVRNVRLSVEKNEEPETLQEKMRLAQSSLDRAAKTNLIKKGNAKRKVSRLTKLIRNSSEASA